MKQKRSGSLRWLLMPAAAILALLCFFTAISELESGRSDQGRAQLEAALRRSAVACYAAEGIYPPELSYLEEHYGLQIDEERYIVHYDVFGSNMMPDITVLDNE